MTAPARPVRHPGRATLREDDGVTDGDLVAFLQARVAEQDLDLPKVEETQALIGELQLHLIVSDEQHDEYDMPVRDAALRALKWLASVYHDHPDYRPEWQPGA